MQHSLYSGIFYLSAAEFFFSALDFYWVQSPNEVAERAVVCDGCSVNFGNAVSKLL